MRRLYDYDPINLRAGMYWWISAAATCHQHESAKKQREHTNYARVKTPDNGNNRRLEAGATDTRTLRSEREECCTRNIEGNTAKNCAGQFAAT
jgi:hypothetical protein